MAHHGAALQKIIGDKKLVEDIKQDFSTANLNDEDKTMLLFALKLTKETCNVSETDIYSLRNVAFTDKAILEIVQVAAYFNFVNRLVCGLGIKQEEIFQ